MKRKRGKKISGGFDLSSFNGKVPPVIRILDDALAVAGWPRGARRKMLNAIKSGGADRSVVDVLEEDTCANQQAGVSQNQGMRNAAQRSSETDLAWPLGYASR